MHIFKNTISNGSRNHSTMKGSWQRMGSGLDECQWDSRTRARLEN